MTPFIFVIGMKDIQKNHRKSRRRFACGFYHMVSGQLRTLDVLFRHLIKRLFRLRSLEFFGLSAFLAVAQVVDHAVVDRREE